MTLTQMTKDEKIELVNVDLYSRSKIAAVGHSTNSNKSNILHFSSWSVLDTEPCQLVWAVGL